MLKQTIEHSHSELMQMELIDELGNPRYHLQELISMKDQKTTLLQQLMYEHQALTSHEEHVGDKVR